MPPFTPRHDIASCAIDKAARIDPSLSMTSILAAVPPGSLAGAPPSAGPENTTTVLLLRHGETDANKAGVLQGQSESDLTRLGQMQARALGAALNSRFQMGFCSNLAPTIYTSDLKRAFDTATIVLNSLGSNVSTGGEVTLKSDVRLRERRLGPFQGHSSADCQKRWPKSWASFVRGDVDSAAALAEDGARLNGGIERSDEMAERARAVLEEIAAAHRGKTILVVSHGGFVHTSVATLTSIPPDSVAHIGNCSITTMVVPASGVDGPWDAISVGENISGGAWPAAAASRNVDLPS